MALKRVVFNIDWRKNVICSLYKYSYQWRLIVKTVVFISGVCFLPQPITLLFYWPFFSQDAFRFTSLHYFQRLPLPCMCSSHVALAHVCDAHAAAITTFCLPGCRYIYIIHQAYSDKHLSHWTPLASGAPLWFSHYPC